MADQMPCAEIGRRRVWDLGDLRDSSAYAWVIAQLFERPTIYVATAASSQVIDADDELTTSASQC